MRLEGMHTCNRSFKDGLSRYLSHSTPYLFAASRIIVPNLHEVVFNTEGHAFPIIMGS